MKHFLVILFSFMYLLSYSVVAQDFDFNPVGKDCEQEVYLEFTVCYSEEFEQPYWVSYYLTQHELELPSQDRPSRFMTDDNISTGSATHDDYTNTGYDRGHLTRAMYNKASRGAYLESFNMSNVSPQIGNNFNRRGGDWYDLEELEIDIAYALDGLYSVTGPIFGEVIEVIGDDTAIPVPRYFFKAFLSPDKSQAIGFIIENDAIDGTNLWSTAVTIDELEGKTIMNLFGKLDNKTEADIESSLNLEYWIEKAAQGNQEQRN